MKRYNINLEELRENVEDEIVESETTEQSPEDLELEHQRLALEIDEDSKEIDRQSELVEGLESLRMIAEKIGTPSPTEVALFRVAANMAVVGTEKRAQDFLPAMESNKPIALEGFGTKIMDMIKAIIAKLKEWWNKFKDFIKGLFSKEKRVEANIEKVHEEIKQKIIDKAEPTSSKVILSSEKILDSFKKSYNRNKVETPKLKVFEPVIKPEEKNEVKPEYKKPENLNFELFVNNLLISKANKKDSKINLNSVNFTIEQIGSLAGISMWSIVPYYKSHCERFLKILEADFQSFKDFNDFTDLLRGLEHETKMRKELALSIIESSGDDYFNNSHDAQNPNPVLNDHFSSFLKVKIDQNNSTSHFNLSVTSFDGGSDFHDEKASSSDYVKCENVTPDIRKLLNLFNTNIAKTKENKVIDYKILDNNSKDIEKINIELQTFAEKIAKVITDSKEEEILIKTHHIKQITDLCVLLNNTQKFSVKCLDVYYDSLEARTNLYRELIHLYN